MDNNRRFAELAGIRWYHEYPHSADELNPDYTDAREVLRVMYNTEEYGPFLIYLWGTQHIQANDVLAVASVPLFYVLDTTGKLRDLAIAWMEGGKEAGG